MWKIKMRICQRTHFQISNYSDYMLGITQFDLSQNDFTAVTLPTAISLSGFPFNIALNNPQCCPGSWSGFAGKETFFLCLVPDPAFVSHPLLILRGFMNSPSPSTHWPLFSLWLAYRVLFEGAKCKHTSLFYFQIGASEINEIKNSQIKLPPSLSERGQLAGKQAVGWERITFLPLLLTCWRC